MALPRPESASRPVMEAAHEVLWNTQSYMCEHDGGDVVAAAGHICRGNERIRNLIR